MLEIKVIEKANEVIVLRPIDVYHKPEGKVYRIFQQPKGGKRLKESHPSYLISSGYNECPILIFYFDSKYRLAPTDLDGLKEYLPHVWVEEVNAEVSLSVKINGLA